MAKWILELECGHTVKRKIMTRKSDGHWRKAGEDPAPEWVYCEFCAAEEENRQQSSPQATPPTEDGAPPPPWSRDEER